MSFSNKVMVPSEPSSWNNSRKLENNPNTTITSRINKLQHLPTSTNKDKALSLKISMSSSLMILVADYLKFFCQSLVFSEPSPTSTKIKTKPKHKLKEKSERNPS